MKKLYPQHLTKGQIIAIVVLSALFGTIPLFVYEAKEPPSEQVEAATLVLQQFPGLEWSKPNQEKVSVLLNEGTSEESVVLATGQKSSAASTINISTEIADFYKKQFVGKNFVELRTYGDPKKDTYWIRCYRKDSQYAEVQYYPTPYQTDSFTVVLFFGVLPEES